MKTLLPARLFALLLVSGCSSQGVSVVSYSHKITACALPDPNLTPGFLCTDSDPNFDGYRYPEQIAHCQRNVPRSEKNDIADNYGVDRSTYSEYEFDHLIPLGIGGSDDESNIWPQPKDEAVDKDKLEEQLYIALRDGTMTQADAVSTILAWRPSCQ
jgi:hypothetical protein